jgi:hypothetical protein
MTGNNDRTWAINAAKAILAKCAANDPWFPQPSETTILAWAEHIMSTNLDLDDLLNGVTVAYGVNGDGFHPQPKDILDAARAIRRDRLERESDAEREARQERLAAKVAEEAEAIAEAKSPDEPKRRRPTINPLNVACPWEACHASAGNPCTVAWFKHTRIPLRKAPRYHPSRIDAAKAQQGSTA